MKESQPNTFPSSRPYNIAIPSAISRQMTPNGNDGGVFLPIPYLSISQIRSQLQRIRTGKWRTLKGLR